jgi:glycosyltransferase involved in cell wall biosynthesis
MRERIVMAESSDIYHDYRVQKEALTLAAAGYDVLVYGFRNSRQRPAGATFPFALRTLPVASRRYRALRNLTMLIDIALINLVLVATRARCYHAHNTMFLVGMWLGSRLHGGRFIYDAHEVQWELGRVPAALEACFIRRADGIINVASGRARAMAARYGIPLERITVVSNYPVFDPYVAAPAAAGADGPVRLVFSGGFNLDNNRLDLLLGALRHVPGVDLSLMAFGYGDGEEVLRRLIAGYGLAERVRFLPLVKPHEVMGAIRGFDAAVNLLINPRDDIAIRFPSVNKMYEYLAAGLPILCSDIEGFQEEFVREGVAVSVNALDEASIADGLRSLVGNRARLPKMKERAVELARDRYNWATQGAQLTALYHRLAPAVSAPN